MLRRLRYPTRVRQHVVAIVRSHSFHIEGEWTGVRARRFLAEHGDALALDLVEHKLADLAANGSRPRSSTGRQSCGRRCEAERGSPHRVGDLAVSGRDLIELGFEEGPELGRVLHALLEAVIDNPSRNDRETLLARAARERS